MGMDDSFLPANTVFKAVISPDSAAKVIDKIQAVPNVGWDFWDNFPMKTEVNEAIDEKILRMIRDQAIKALRVDSKSFMSAPCYGVRYLLDCRKLSGKDIVRDGFREAYARVYDPVNFFFATETNPIEKYGRVLPPNVEIKVTGNNEKKAYELVVGSIASKYPKSEGLTQDTDLIDSVFDQILKALVKF